MCPRVSGLEFVKGDAVAVPTPGKVVVLECWASWCGPCRSAFPHISDLQRKYRSRGLRVVGVTNEANPGQVRSFVNSQGPAMDYSVAMDADGEVQEKVLAPAGVRGIPHAFVIDGSGVVQYSGHPMDPSFEQAVVSCLDRLQPQEKPLPLITASRAELEAMPVRDLKAILSDRNVSLAGLMEKSELVDKILNTCTKTVYYAKS